MTSPARAALSAHLTKMDNTRADIEAARQPVRELEDRMDAARATQRGDEADLAAILQAEAADIVDCGRAAPAVL